MGEPDVFSRRATEGADSARRDGWLSEEFRVLVVNLWDRALGTPEAARVGPVGDVWRSIHDRVAAGYGEFYLDDPDTDPATQCRRFLFKAGTARALDVIEMSLQAVDREVRAWGDARRAEAGIVESADGALATFNLLCRQHTTGYEYVDGIIVPVSSRFLQSEVIQPAAVLLHEKGFEQPSRDFMTAFDHYREGRYEEALVSAGRAFESTIKAICQARGWAYDSHATAKTLVDTVFDNELVPAALQSQFSQLRGLVGSGLMTLRNKFGAHGPAPGAAAVAGHIAAFGLHLAAANIVFLVQAHRSKP